MKILRNEQGWSLEELSGKCGISRATLSRMENAEVSPTASALGKLCSVYCISMSRLMTMIETEFAPLVRKEQQSVWSDPGSGYIRRSVSPPAQSLAGELLECYLPPDTRIEYKSPSVPGMEHHLYVLDGELEMTIEHKRYSLKKGDCLRYQLYGSSSFETGKTQSVRYVLAIM